MNGNRRSSRRWYRDGCAGAHALNLVGERWALLVVRELLLGPKRFTDLRRDLPGIGPNVLSQRLEELSESGVIVKRRLPPPFAVQVYELTEWGHELETVICELGRWGARSPALPRDAELGVNSMVLSLRTMFSAEAAAGFSARLELRFGEDVFQAVVGDGEFSIERGTADEPDVIVSTTPAALARLVYDGDDVRAAIEAGEVEIIGSARVFKRFVRLFPLPQRAEPVAG